MVQRLPAICAGESFLGPSQASSNQDAKPSILLTLMIPDLKHPGFLIEMGPVSKHRLFRLDTS